MKLSLTHRPVFSLLLLLSFAACKTASSNPEQSKAKAESIVSDGLDVNDVSILFPLPRKFSDASKMLSISFVNNSGKMPMTDDLFKQILARHNTKQIIDGKEEALSSGSSFSGFSNIIPDRPMGPFDQIGDWKIVAMRYDPCAPSINDNRLLRQMSEAPKVFDQNECQAQLRLTAQPVLHMSKEELQRERLDSEVLVSDYALHMIYALSPQQSSQLYGALKTFKAECNDVTSSIPLGIHPCLAIEAKGAPYAGPHFQKVIATIKQFAEQLVGIAMFASNVSNDPWTFMNGRVVDGKFVHLPIAAVHKTDPATIRRSKNGEMLESFLNGYFQMMSFKTVNSVNKDNTQRVTPMPIPDKTNVAFKDEFNLARKLTAKDTETIENSYSTFNKIENPLHSDFFSTDCVSCHIASDLSFSYFLQSETTFKDPKMKLKNSASNSLFKAEISNDTGYLLAKQKREGFFSLPQYAHIVAPSDQARSEISPTSQNPYGLIHFGYLFGFQMVSVRVANESALVAKTANNFFNQGRDPRNTCPHNELNICLSLRQNATFLQARDSSAIVPTNLFESCMLKVCPTRAKELTAYFDSSMAPSWRPKIHRAIKDINIVSTSQTAEDPKILSGVTLRKGTILIGTLVNRSGNLKIRSALPISVFDEENKADALIISEDLIHLQSMKSKQIEDFSEYFQEL